MICTFISCWQPFAQCSTRISATRCGLVPAYPDVQNSIKDAGLGCSPICWRGRNTMNLQPWMWFNLLFRYPKFGYRGNLPAKPTHWCPITFSDLKLENPSGQLACQTNTLIRFKPLHTLFRPFAPSNYQASITQRKAWEVPPWLVGSAIDRMREEGLLNE